MLALATSGLPTGSDPKPSQGPDPPSGDQRLTRLNSCCGAPPTPRNPGGRRKSDGTTVPLPIARHPFLARGCHRALRLRRRSAGASRPYACRRYSLCISVTICCNRLSRRWRSSEATLPGSFERHDPMGEVNCQDAAGRSFPAPLTRPTQQMPYETYVAYRRRQRSDRFISADRSILRR